MFISYWMLVGTNTKGMVDLGSLEGKGKKCDKIHLVKEGERPATEHQKGSALVGSPGQECLTFERPKALKSPSLFLDFYFLLILVLAYSTFSIGHHKKNFF